MSTENQDQQGQTTQPKGSEFKHDQSGASSTSTGLGQEGDKNFQGAADGGAGSQGKQTAGQENAGETHEQAMKGAADQAPDLRSEERKQRDDRASQGNSENLPDQKTGARLEDQA